jgi:hypothetical protein
MMRSRSFVLFVFFMVLGAMTAEADLYQCKTGRGTINYTNKPCIDQAPAKPKRLETQRKPSNMTLLDPSQLMAQQQQVTVVAPTAAVTTTPAESSVTEATTSSTAEPELQAIHHQDADKFSITHYREGMQWLLQHKGFFAHYEHYEITHVENDIIKCQRTLLNANKEPFAGGISEEFTLDLRQQSAISKQNKPLNIAGYLFDTQQHQGEQATIWQVSQLPLITPLIRYNNGDETVLVEFVP